MKNSWRRATRKCTSVGKIQLSEKYWFQNAFPTIFQIQTREYFFLLLFLILFLWHEHGDYYHLNFINGISVVEVNVVILCLFFWFTWQISSCLVSKGGEGNFSSSVIVWIKRGANRPAVAEADTGAARCILKVRCTAVILPIPRTPCLSDTKNNKFRTL